MAFTLNDIDLQMTLTFEQVLVHSLSSSKVMAWTEIQSNTQTNLKLLPTSDNKSLQYLDLFGT